MKGIIGFHSCKSTNDENIYVYINGVYIFKWVYCTWMDILFAKVRRTKVKGNLDDLVYTNVSAHMGLMKINYYEFIIVRK